MTVPPGQMREGDQKINAIMRNHTYDCTSWSDERRRPCNGIAQELSCSPCFYIKKKKKKKKKPV